MNLLFILPGWPEHLIQAFCWTLVHSVWEGILLAVAAACTIIGLKKAPAALRYNLLAAELALFAAGIGFTFLQMLETPAGVAGHFGVAGAGQGQIVDFSAFLNHYAGWIVAIWSILVLMKSGKIGLDLLCIEWIRRSGQALPGPVWHQKISDLARQSGVRMKVRLLESGRIAAPSVVGIFAPVILLPVGMLAQLPPGQAEAILLHELAHIRRRDYLVNLLQHVAEAAFFFHPAVLWVSGLLREERENCCDDLAVSILGNRVDYLNALLFSESFTATPPRYALGFQGRKGHLYHRVVRIIENRNTKTLSYMEKISLIVSTLLIGLVAWIPLTETGAQNPPATQNSTPAGVQLEKEKAEQAEMDKKQAEMDAEQAQRDKEQAERDAQQAKLDQEQAKLDAAQAKLDAEQAKRDAEQAKRDAVQAKRDAAQAKRDAAQAKKEAERAKREE